MFVRMLSALTHARVLNQEQALVIELCCLVNQIGKMFGVIAVFTEANGSSPCLVVAVNPLPIFQPSSLLTMLCSWQEVDCRA